MKKSFGKRRERKTFWIRLVALICVLLIFGSVLIGSLYY